MRNLFPLLVPMLLLISACGFHLRGSQPAAGADAVDSVHLRETRAAEVAREVRAQLEEAGVEMVSDPEAGEYLLALSNQRVDRNVLSVSAETGKAEEYQLILTVQMTVARYGGETLVENEIIQISRDYTFDDDAVLGKFSEEQVLQSEMIRSAVARIISRLNAVARNR